MAKRLTWAKTKITAARIPYRVPPAQLLAERTSGVLALMRLHHSRRGRLRARTAAHALGDGAPVPAGQAGGTPAPGC